MASEGPRSCGTAADDSGVGTLTWANPTSAQGTSDASAAIAEITPSGAISHYLKCTNFNFSAIPDGATVDGIVVEYLVWGRFSTTVRDYRVRIVKGGTIGSTDKSSATPYADGDYAWVSRGGSNDLWGETWSATDIKSSGFGFAVAATDDAVSPGRSQVDAVRVTVYYTAGGPTYLPRIVMKRKYRIIYTPHAQ